MPPQRRVAKNTDVKSPTKTATAKTAPDKPKTIDDLLRANRFEIHCRPNKGPNRWKRGGEHYTQEEALSMCDKNEVANAESVVESPGNV